MHSFITIALQLQGCPSDNITLTESGCILQQKGVHELIVEIAFAQQNYFLNLLGCNPLRLQISTKLVDIVARFLLVVKHFRNASHNLVATELLLGTWGYQSTGVRGAFFCTLLLYVLIFNEVVIENLFLYHLLVI